MKKTVKGFTLIEVMLVMVIMSAIVVGIAKYSTQKTYQMRQDRAVLQIQQLLNAGLAYYLNNTNWPSSIGTDLQGNGTTTGGYLPTGISIVNPWGQSYLIGHTTATSAPNALFTVCTTVSAGKASPTTAQILAGRLPMAYVVNGAATTCTPPPAASTCTSTSCTVVATVNVPGQNLNNARAVNFAGLYRNGACVAAPKCPGNMTPTMFAVPVSVSGMNYETSKVYPLTSFTAFPSLASPVASGSVPACPADTTYTPSCVTSSTTSNDLYWRVCMQIITQRGVVDLNSSTGRDAALIMAITRCMPQGEDTTQTVSGTTFDIFGY